MTSHDTGRGSVKTLPFDAFWTVFIRRLDAQMFFGIGRVDQFGSSHRDNATPTSQHSAAGAAPSLLNSKMGLLLKRWGFHTDGTLQAFNILPPSCCRCLVI